MSAHLGAAHRRHSATASDRRTQRRQEEGWRARVAAAPRSPVEGRPSRDRDHGGRGQPPLLPLATTTPPLPSSSEHARQPEFSGCRHHQAFTPSGKAEHQAQKEEAQDQRRGKAHLSQSEAPAQSRLLPARVPSLTPRPLPGAEQEASSSTPPPPRPPASGPPSLASGPPGLRAGAALPGLTTGVLP